MEVDAEAEAEADADADADDTPLLPNLCIHDIPYGEWSTEMIAQDIRERWHAARPVVVLNSFEYGAAMQHQKGKMVSELIDLQKRMGNTFVIFTHEMRQDRMAGMPGRGPLGILCGKAGSVVHLKDPFEHLVRSRKLANQAGKGLVHEAQMHLANRGVGKGGRGKESGASINGRNLYPDYRYNPWIGTTELTGEDFILSQKRHS